MRPYIILILLIIIAFANSLQNSFVWDDFFLIINNQRINLPFREIPSIFTMPLWKFAEKTNAIQDYYRPMVSFFYVLNYKIWGPSPAGFHLTNIIFHTIITIVLYKVGLLLLDNEKLLSLIGASIFAVHPTHNELVGRAAGELMVGFFLILSFYYFLREKQYLSWITFFLALLSKELAVMFPFALVILAVHKKGLKKGIISIMPYIVLVGIFLVIRAILVDTFLGIKAGQPIFVQIFTMAAATLDYIRLLIIPYPLSPYYPERWYTSIFDPKVVFAMVVLMLVLFFAFKIRKDKVMFFLLAFIFFMLAPVIFKVNTFPIGYEHVYIAERFLYVSLMPFSLFVSAYAFRLVGDGGKKYLLTGAGLLIAVFMVITISSNMVWRNDLTLFGKITKEFPAAAFAHNNLGNVYMKQGLSDKAIEQYQIAIRLRPNDSEPYYNLGVIYQDCGFIDRAIEWYRVAIKLSPDDPKPYYNLGTIYQSQGLIDKAIGQYRIAIKLKPDDPKTHNNLGNAYSSMGFIDKAIEQFRMAIKLRPDDPKPYYNLGTIYQSQGLIDKAIEQYLIAIRLEPYDPGPYNNLGSAYESKGSMDSAIEQYRIALRLKSDLDVPHFNLGRIYFRRGDMEEARKEFEIVLRINPRFHEVRKFLALTYLSQNEPPRRRDGGVSKK
ncbi:MAG: tetratricopeptide repeat protein [Nitrospirae bacterium]|nr:tetratricopeptide repeat protein [Nitrospirota bacterium]